MFPEDLKNSSKTIHTDKIKLGFEIDPLYESKDLLKKGYVKESITEDDDSVTIIKEFISFDRSFSKKDKITIDKDTFDEIKLKGKDKEEILSEITTLKQDLEKATTAQHYEQCAIIRDRISLLSKIIAS